MALGRRLEIATCCEDERDAAILKRIGERPGGFLAQVEVEDGEVKALRFDLGERICDASYGRADAMAHHVDEILEHHGDKRFVLNDKNVACVCHGFGNMPPSQARKALSGT
ncbi:hypothetical protein LTR94_021066 [Friedmanniomyces endolithicus]|nr:hypothetical protein LTR94_021066 [Friedmanniomyces endolithicus]